ESDADDDDYDDDDDDDDSKSTSFLSLVHCLAIGEAAVGGAQREGILLKKCQVQKDHSSWA
ncbi:unnamed protein product, partial [Sphagnum troendelagicum]